MARHFSNVDTAEEVLNDILEGKYTYNVAYGLLNQIINDLPNTWVAKKAEEIKKERYS